MTPTLGENIELRSPVEINLPALRNRVGSTS